MISQPIATTAPDQHLDAIENKLRAHIFAMRIRLVDLFADFDKLRSGFITASQFRRCIGAAYDKGVVSNLSQAELDVLVNHYDVKKNGMIKWRAFVDSIDKVFGAKKLEQTPTKYIPAPHEVVQPFGPIMSPRSESVLSEVIERLRSYVKHHGSDVKSWFKDFDKYNNGYVTYNQFRRGIPQNLLSIEEEDILLARYGESVTSTVNYFKMNTDVNRKAPRPKVDVAQLVAKLKLDPDYEHEHVPVGTEELLHGNVTSYGAGKPNLVFVENKIKKYIYKNRIRLIEFFRDYDKHNSGHVSEAQFLAGLRLSSLPLEDPEVAVILSAYGNKEGRIQYRKFCNSIDTVYTTINLEKNPLADVKPPSRDWLVQGSNELSPAEEARCSEIIARFRGLMAERRLLLAPFFKDFDKYLGNLGRVTRSHFSRLLSTMKMDISDDDLHILFKKYEDRSQAKVNYMEFIRTIDPESKYSKLFILAYQNYRKNLAIASSDVSQEFAVQNESKEELSIQLIITRIRAHVSTKRIRISDFFRDFDKLRCYSIPRHEFIRSVDMIECHLSSEALESLADYYQDVNKKGCCKWKDFSDEIEKVFVEVGLEAKPSHKPSPIKVQRNPYMTTNAKLTPEEQKLLDKTLNSIREHLRIRQWTASVKPFFKDFDKVCTGTGHVTRAQFRQCLTYMKIQVNDEEFDVLCKKWAKDPGTVVTVQSDLEKEKDYIQDCAQSICYLMFLQEIDQEGGKKESDGATIPSDKVLKSPLKRQEDTLEKIMLRIKTKAKRERIRVIDFMHDFDQMRHGKITKNEFRRGLKSIFSNLNEHELRLLENAYQSHDDANMVNYVNFSDEVESVFTQKGLEKNPTAEINQFIPADFDPQVNELSAKDQVIYEKIITRMVEKVRQRRIDPLTYLEDYDFIKEGTITTNQFRSCLYDVGLGVNDEEIVVLAKKFATSELDEHQEMDRINYRSFADALSKRSGLQFMMY